jgi:hypothetical protein
MVMAQGQRGGTTIQLDSSSQHQTIKILNFLCGAL